MLIPPMFDLRGRRIYNGQEYDNYADSMEISERLRKTLYYGKPPKTERSSLPLTEFAVEFCQDAARRELGKVDSFTASTLARRACMSPCSMMLGMLYIERLKRKNPGYLRKVSSSDLFFISMMMASKYVYDEGVEEEVFNDEWAESARMDIDELNDLEIDFLSAIDWSLFVRPEDFHQVMNTVERRIALQQALGRNWFSYTDMWVLLQDPKYGHHCLEISKDLGKVVIVISLAYVASILTLVASVVTLTYLSADIASVGPVLLPLPIAVLEQPSYRGNNLTNENTTEGKEDDKIDFTEEMRSIISAQADDRSSRILESPDSVKMTNDMTLNSVLPQLWAVVTWKDAFVHFVSAFRNPQSASPRNLNSPLSCNDNGQLSPLSSLFCRPGPCSSTAALTCRNVSNPGFPNLRSHSSGSVGKPPTSKNCCNRCGKQIQDSSLRKRVGSPQQQQHGLTCSPYSEIRCCCRRVSSLVDPWELQMDPFPDIILGFHTSTLNPLTAKT